MVTGEMYTKYLHGIAERSCDLINDKLANIDMTNAVTGSTLERNTRVSLTIRHVPKVLKAKVFLGTRH